MDTDCARGTSDFTHTKLHSVSQRIEWKTVALFFVVMLACTLVGVFCHTVLVPGEARHVGIVHDMWAARQYLVPRVNGLPALDGAPLHYWISLVFIGVFGVSEWVVRLPSVLAAALTLGMLVRAWSPWLPPRSAGTLFILFLIQPALVVAARFASPDMLNVLLFTVSVHGFMNAAHRVEQRRPARARTLGAWMACGLLALSAGPLAAVVPVTAVAMWLILRRRFAVLGELCWLPGPLACLAVVLPWLLIAENRYPGIVHVFFKKDLQSLWGLRPFGWVEMGGQAYAALVVAGVLPLAACLYRLRDPARRQWLNTPVAGLMAVCFVVLLPMHPLVMSTLVGPAAVLALPLLFFGVLALAPVQRPVRRSDLLVWLLHVALLVVVGVAGSHYIVKRVSGLSPLVQSISQRYHATNDKVVLLDRFDYEFNFYMRSPKLVYVVSDWNDAGRSMPVWKADLYDAARFAPDAASRLLLSHDELLEKLCERRVVNLWLIGDRQSIERHPILLEMSALHGPDGSRAWYLEAATHLAACQQQPD